MGRTYELILDDLRDAEATFEHCRRLADDYAELADEQLVRVHALKEELKAAETEQEKGI